MFRYPFASNTPKNSIKSINSDSWESLSIRKSYFVISIQLDLPKKFQRNRKTLSTCKAIEWGKK